MKAAAPDRFSPRGELTPEQLKAYLEGRLDPAAQHDVELHMQQDPLVQEALEGLTLPHGLAGLAQLDGARPSVNTNTAWPWLAGGAVALMVTAGLWSSTRTRGIDHITEQPTPSNTKISPSVRLDVTQTAPLAVAEIDAAVEIPETLHIGHASTDRHAITMRTEVEVSNREPITVERLMSRTPDVDTLIDPNTVRPERAKRPSIHLMYLYDLKLVDPKDLYAVDPMLLTDERHVTPDFSDRNAQRAGEEPQRRIHYMPYMGRAMAKFARNEHKACLEDLRFLLTQYPDDVNALFYAGLCSYNLDLNERALNFLHRAAIHPITVFDEEATWYHALTLERLGQEDAAREEYSRIASAGGFYAVRAASRNSRH